MRTTKSFRSFSPPRGEKVAEGRMRGHPFVNVIYPPACVPPADAANWMKYAMFIFAGNPLENVTYPNALKEVIDGVGRFVPVTEISPFARIDALMVPNAAEV